MNNQVSDGLIIEHWSGKCMYQNWFIILIQGRKFKIVLLLLFLFDYEQNTKLKKKIVRKKIETYDDYSSSVF